MKAILYSRVSTDEQNPHAQMIILEKAAAARNFVIVEKIEEVESSRNERPGLKCALKLLEDGTANAIIVWDLSRLARSVIELAEMSKFFQEKNITLICINHPVDTSTAAGKLFFHLTAAFAEFERDIISDNTKAAFQSGVHQNWGKRGKDRIPRQKRKDRGGARR